jgi:rhodanese-related sulfurtransferase
MDPIVAFLLHHWILSFALLLSISVLILMEGVALLAASQQITPQQLVQLINQDQVKIIDLRSEEEFQQGHIIHSISIPLMSLKKELEPLNGFKNQALVLVHTTSQPTHPLINQLIKRSFKKVNVLKGGMQAWTQANLPLEK